LDRERKELVIIGSIILGGNRTFRRLPVGFTRHVFKTTDLRFIFAAICELVSQGTPRSWFSPLAIAREFDRAEPCSSKEHKVFEWCRRARKAARKR
jgi:hypothetical protein